MPANNKRIYLLFSFLILTFLSCNWFKSKDTTNDNTPIDPSFILKTDSTINNQPELLKIKLSLNQNKEGVGMEKTNFNFVAPKSKAGVIKFNAMKGSPGEPEMVSVKDAIGKLFEPSSAFCDLPNYLSSKIEKLKKEGKPWCPDYVAAFASKMPDSALHFQGLSITYILHTVTIKKTNSDKLYKFLASSSPTYENFDVANYIIKTAQNFLYTLDGSGYLNAAISSTATPPLVNLKGSAKSAMDKKSSLVIMGGIVYSPLVAAYDDNNSKTLKIDTPTRIAILNAIINYQDVADSDILNIGYSYWGFWSSKSGSQSYNGEAEISGSGGGGIGIASVTASAGGGVSVSRKSNFADFDSYILQQQPLENIGTITVAKIKEKILSLQKKN